MCAYALLFVYAGSRRSYNLISVCVRWRQTYKLAYLPGAFGVFVKLKKRAVHTIMLLWVQCEWDSNAYIRRTAGEMQPDPPQPSGVLCAGISVQGASACAGYIPTRTLMFRGIEEKQTSQGAMARHSDSGSQERSLPWASPHASGGRFLARTWE